MTDDDEDKKEPLHKNFYVKVIFVFLLVSIFYYMFSPLQNCKRYVYKESDCYNKKFTDLNW